MLAPTSRSCPPACTGNRIAVCSRSASSSHRSWVTAGSRTANSSPPIRATSAPAGSVPAIRCATITSSSSPTACPNRSLTALKPLRSSSSTWGVPAASAVVSRRSKPRRLASPVSSSCMARSSSRLACRCTCFTKPQVRASTSRNSTTAPAPMPAQAICDGSRRPWRKSSPGASSVHAASTVRRRPPTRCGSTPVCGRCRMLGCRAEAPQQMYAIRKPESTNPPVYSAVLEAVV